MEFTSPTISIIIPTKHRPKDLERTVQSLLQQTSLPSQLIIIDQSETRENRDRIENLHRKLPQGIRETLKLSYVHDPTIVGPIVARNRGMMIAEAEIIAFFDDDVLLEPNYLKELIATYTGYPNLGGVSGIITNYERPPWLQRLWTVVFVRGPFLDERQPIYWKANALRNSEPILVRKFTGACMSFRTKVTQGHWFDENLPNTFEEDWDFCIDLGPGVSLAIAPNVRLSHLRSVPGRSRQHHLRNEARSTHYLYRKRWHRGTSNGLAFLWINFGYALIATAGALKSLSLGPWRALLSGAAEGRMLSRRIGRAFRT